MTKSTEQQNEGNFTTAIETIRLLGEHVIELREIIQSQREEIVRLRSDMDIIRQSQKDFDADFNLLCIDQKDLLKQIRELKKTKIESSPREAISYEDIVKRYYPSYASNPEFAEPVSPAIKNKASKAVPQRKSEDLNGHFARLPRFLNLD